MIDCKKQIITQKYKGEAHKGIDLRSWDFKNKCLLPVIAPEDLVIVRMGTDRHGNDFIVCMGAGSNYELKFIHISYNHLFRIGDFIIKTSPLGFTQIKGNSKRHHLHFETWRPGQHFNPCDYYKEIGVKFGKAWRKG